MTHHVLQSMILTPAQPRRQPNQTRAPRLRFLPLLVGALILVLWFSQTQGGGSTSFVLASPGAVLDEFIKLVGNGTLFRHIGTTLLEISLGFSIGVSIAFVLGYGIARNRFLEQLLGPYAVGFQAVPIVAIAPVLIRFFGPGLATNSVICALIVFFPMLMSTIVGMRGIDRDLGALMRSLNATRWQTFTRLEIPGALPSLFAGLKISTTLAVAAAVVAEGFGANAGLGYLVYSSRYVYNTAGVLVGVFTLTALALILYEVVVRLERRLLAWQRLGH